MRTKAIVILAIFALLAFAISAQAQTKGWGPGSKYQRMYNPATVETVTGTVESVEKFTPERGMSQGVHIMIKTDKVAIPVHLGPSWYIDKQNVKLEKGDKVEVKGSSITFKGQPAIIAEEVTKDGATMKLRDEKGTPLWSGMKR